MTSSQHDPKSHLTSFEIVVTQGVQNLSSVFKFENNEKENRLFFKYRQVIKELRLSLEESWTHLLSAPNIC